MSVTRFATCLALSCYFALLGSSALALDAFPGAAGHGKGAQGGRAGRIIFVTTLSDAGAGSLRACVEATGKRICVFRVGGIIRLKTPLGVRAANGELSILGQTAPGGGILLTIGPAVPAQVNAVKTAFFVKNTHDVVVRHVRIRLQYPASVNADTVTIEGSARVYLDHISGSWAPDENFSTYANATNLTVAYSIFGEGLDTHSKCALLGADPSAPQRISFWRSMCISNNDRNPDNNHFGGSCIEITNNVFYNARSEWAEVFSQFPGGTPIIYASNYFKAGPNTNHSTFAIDWQGNASVASPRIYLYRNATEAPVGSSITLVAPDTTRFLVSTPPCPLSAAVIDSAFTALDHVRSRAGAFPRDSVDKRLVNEVGARGMLGTGSIKNAAGILPGILTGAAYVDVDKDGMADSVESTFGGRVGVYDPWADNDADGWPNFDEFAQWLSDTRIAGAYPN